MSFQPFDRNPSGIVFFGTSATDKVYRSLSAFTYDALQNSLRLPNGGYIGSQDDFDSIQIASDGNVTLSQSLSIAGNLTVNGTTTTVNSTAVTIQDPVIVLGSGASTTDDNRDRGIAFNWHTGTAARSGFFGWDDSIQGFALYSTGNMTNDVFAGQLGWLTVQGVSGALAGNASTATTLATARNFSISGEMIANVQSFDGSAAVVLTGSLHQTAISAQPEITSVNDVGTDFILIWDDTDDDLKRISRANFVSGFGSMSSFTISDLSGGTQTINDGNTLAFAPGAAITFTVTATDTVSGTLSANVAGNGLTMSSQVLAVGAGNGITVAADTVAVTDGSGILVNTGGVHANLISYTSQSVAANAASTTAGRTYPIQVNGSDQLVVNVPWTDADTTYTAGSGLTLVGTTFHFNPSQAGSGLVLLSDGLHLDLNEFTDTTVGFDDAFLTLDSNNATEQLTTVQDLGSYYAGSGILADGVGKLHWRPTVAYVSASTQLSSNDVNLCAAGAGGITVWLPSGTAGRFMWIKKTDSAAGTVTINRQGTYTIDGATSIILYHQYESVELVSDGSNWFIV
jgi:hypothetical protein